MLLTQWIMQRRRRASHVHVAHGSPHLSLAAASGALPLPYIRVSGDRAGASDIAPSFGGGGWDGVRGIAAIRRTERVPGKLGLRM